MIYGSLCFSGVQEKLTFWHTRISSGDCMNGLVARRRIGVIHLRRDDECSKNSGEGKIHNLLKIQIVQKVCLAQSRIGRGRDCMNRLVCRRRIGVIHLRRDDRCWAAMRYLLSLSRARLTSERSANNATPSIIWDPQILTHEPIWCGNRWSTETSQCYSPSLFLSLPSSKPMSMSLSPRCQCRGFARDNLSGLPLDIGSVCIYNKEGSIMNGWWGRRNMLQTSLNWSLIWRNSCSNTVPFCNIVKPSFPLKSYGRGNPDVNGKPHKILMERHVSFYQRPEAHYLRQETPWSHSGRLPDKKQEGNPCNWDPSFAGSSSRK